MKIKSTTEHYRHPKGHPTANWLRATIADMLRLPEILPNSYSHWG